MKSKYFIFSGVLLVVVLLGIGGFLLLHNNRDSFRFKEEYESLNGTIRESDGALYNSVFIDKKNPIRYIDSKKAVSLLDSKEAIIYVGANWCPWCRNAIPVLFDVAQKYDIKTIYYLNLDDEKSVYEIVDSQLEKKKDGSDSYYELLQKLNSRLDDYTLKGTNGQIFNTGEKRIYMPYVLVIRDGSVVSDHVGTVSLSEGQTKYSALNESQYQELFSVYEKMIKEAFRK